MLEQKDIQIIADLVNGAVLASEERMCDRMDQAIAASEERMIERIAVCEDRMIDRVNAVLGEQGKLEKRVITLEKCVEEVKQLHMVEVISGRDYDTLQMQINALETRLEIQERKTA